MVSLELKLLIDKRDGSKGMKILRFQGVIKNSMDILKLNYETIIDEFNSYDKIARKLWERKNFKKIDSIHKKSIVCLHNYLASLYSFTNHIKSIRKKLGPEFEIVLGKEMKALESDCDIKMAILLRDHVQHFRPPFTSLGQSMSFGEKYEGIKEKATFSIKTKVLLENNKFKKHKVFLEEYGKRIDLKKVVTLSYNRIERFQSWLFSMIKKTFYEDLQEFWGIQIQIDRLIKKKKS